MLFSHFLLILLVVIVWGVNFIFVKLGLHEIPPLLLCTIRFILASIPAIFFIKPPAIPFKVIILYGLVMFALQFSLLFLGMHLGMTPGMASLIIQVQVFFSMFFAAVLIGEMPHMWQIIGAVVSFFGIGIVGMHFDKDISVLGFMCILAAAATWGIGNLITRKTNKVNTIALVVWGSFVASFPLLICSLIFEGPYRIIHSLHHMTTLGLVSIIYIVYISTWVGYGVWNWLLNHYPVGTIVPFTLLVPIVGIMSSVFFLGEPFQTWKALAGLLVISGICINLFGSWFYMKRLEPEAC